MISIFKDVKAAVRVPEAAEFYGITVPRSGKICCLFHSDHHPSLHLYDDHYYCYSCHACGDVIAFTAKLFNLSQLDAARKLAVDFSIVPPPEGYSGADSPVIHVDETDKELEKRLRILSDYERFLRDCMDEYAPVCPESESYDWRFTFSCRELSWIEYMYDCLSSIDESDRKWADHELESLHFYEKMELIVSLNRKETVPNGNDESYAA